jgi:hypothetical protein
MKLPLNLTWDKAQTRWASILNPAITLPPVNGSLLTGVKIVSGSNTFNHLLGRIQQGWIVTDIDADITLYRSAPLNSKTLTLTASGPANLNIWVY